MFPFAGKPDGASKPLLDIYQGTVRRFSCGLRPLGAGSPRIGNTPIRDLSDFSRWNGLRIMAKLEWFNPWGSVKDRVAWYMVKGAEERGELRRGERIIIEPSSGNTGIALTGIAKSLGYSVEVVIPKAASEETKMILRGMGANVWEVEDDLCPRVGRGTDQSISLAKAAVRSHPGKYFMPNQYENLDNVRAHYETTGPEIWRQTMGKITHFVAGIGTGGTVIGVGSYLKERNPRVKVYAVEPVKGHHIQGLRNLEESSMPKILSEKLDVVDEWIKVDDREAFEAAERLYREAGIPAGPSSGAALHGALKVAEEAREGLIVTVFPDGRERHESTFRKYREGLLLKEG